MIGKYLKIDGKFYEILSEPYDDETIGGIALIMIRDLQKREISTVSAHSIYGSTMYDSAVS